MALTIVVEIPGVTQEQYERVVKTVNAAGTPPGALFHVGGPIEGGYRLVEVWASREAAQTFYGSEVLRAATAGLAQPQILMTWPVSGIDNGSGWQAIA